MNLPNQLTVLRTLMVPLFLVLLLIPAIPGRFLWACIVFAAASLTDFLDGQIARKRNMVTNFGKFLDPLADKMLVTAALVAFVSLGLSGPVAVVVIIARDLMVSAIRMIAATEEGQVIAANWWGKVKTASQMIVMIAVLLCCHLSASLPAFYPMETVSLWSRIAMWAVAAFTALSGAVYLIQNRHLINTYK